MHLGILLIIHKKHCRYYSRALTYLSMSGKVISSIRKKSWPQRTREHRQKNEEFNCSHKNKVKIDFLLSVFSEGIQAANDTAGATVHPSCITCKPRPVWGLHTCACAEVWNSAGACLTHQYVSFFQPDYRQKTFKGLILNSGKLSFIYSLKAVSYHSPTWDKTSWPWYRFTNILRKVMNCCSPTWLAKNVRRK